MTELPTGGVPKSHFRDIAHAVGEQAFTSNDPCRARGQMTRYRHCRTARLYLILWGKYIDASKAIIKSDLVVVWSNTRLLLATRLRTVNSYFSPRTEDLKTHDNPGN